MSIWKLITLAFHFWRISGLISTRGPLLETVGFELKRSSCFAMTNGERTNPDYQELRWLLLLARDEIDEALEAIAPLERNRDNDFMLYLEVERIRAKVTEAANEVLPEEPDFNLENEEKVEACPTCEDCGYYADSPYLVCALHPTGPEDNCPDYEDAVGEATLLPFDEPYENPWHSDPEENWAPPGTKYVNGELIFVSGVKTE